MCGLHNSHIGDGGSATKKLHKMLRCTSGVDGQQEFKSCTFFPKILKSIEKVDYELKKS